MGENICRFIPYSRHDETIHTLYFVYEQDFSAIEKEQILAFYKLGIVTSGSGSLTMHGKQYPLTRGDVFFIYPSVPHHIHSDAGSGEDGRLCCIYVSYVGVRANQILSRYHITAAHPVYTGMQELIPFWERAIQLSCKANADILSESVLLYTLSFLGAAENEAAEIPDSDLIHSIKNYIDEHFSDPDLSLTSICTHYSYNPKYISSLFKKHFRVGMNAYLNAIRIQEACTLMQENVTSVQDIAAKCGFRDPYYFSRVFKARLGISPSMYIENQKKM